LGLIKNYDLTINSTVFGLEKTSQLIEEAIKVKEAYHKN
jgi:hypothetical protein